MAKKLEVDLKLVIAAIALIIMATFGSAYFTYLFFESGSNEGALGTGRTSIVEKREIGPTFTAGEFIVNLVANSNQNRFIRTGIVLEVDSRSTITELEKREPQVRDRIISTLRLRSVEELSKTDGLDSLKEDLMKTLNDLLLKGKIVDIYFNELVIQ
ncbi:MAG: flagellar basal body-associated protein FliL [Firmicutes bacterium]|jgi:flagellar FliL protein|nr:flagellar basal body-associated protein FliL [Bacillota bacterium]